MTGLLTLNEDSFFKTLVMTFLELILTYYVRVIWMGKKTFLETKTMHKTTQQGSTCFLILQKNLAIF